MDNASGNARNKAFSVLLVLTGVPVSLVLYEPPKSWLLACASVCFGWYEAFGLLPNMKRNATVPDIYRAFRTMPARNNGLSSRLVGLLGIVLAIAAVFVRT